MGKTMQSRWDDDRGSDDGWSDVKQQLHERSSEGMRLTKKEMTATT
jgi:hypothetical protein